MNQYCSPPLPITQGLAGPLWIYPRCAFTSDRIGDLHFNGGSERPCRELLLHRNGFPSPCEGIMTKFLSSCGRNRTQAVRHHHGHAVYNQRRVRLQLSKDDAVRKKRHVEGTSSTATKCRRVDAVRVQRW